MTRLCIALSARNLKPKRRPDFEDEFHWSLCTGSPHDLLNPTSEEKCLRLYHVKNAEGSWKYEARSVARGYEYRLLVRVIIAEVHGLEELEKIFIAVPVREDARDFNCVAWVRAALEAADRTHGETKEVLSTKVADWEKVKYECLRYCRWKKHGGT